MSGSGPRSRLVWTANSFKVALTALRCCSLEGLYNENRLQEGSVLQNWKNKSDSAHLWHWAILFPWAEDSGIYLCLLCKNCQWLWWKGSHRNDLTRYDENSTRKVNIIPSVKSQFSKIQKSESAQSLMQKFFIILQMRLCRVYQECAVCQPCHK